MDATLPILYLVASVTFIIGLKMLGSPKTARPGNLIAAVGMGIAIAGTIFLYKGHTGEHLHNLGWIFGALVIGSVIGWLMAMRVKMTAMPQMVSFFNGMGGACAALISLLEYKAVGGEALGIGNGLATVAGLLIGSVSFSGSMIAFGKLEEKIGDIRFSGQQIVNNAILLAAIVLAGLIATGNITDFSAIILLAGVALVFGVLFVFPIGGADMPVVISLLNSFTGVAAACGGFIYHNMVMLIGGILVGSAGSILTIVMCRSMNRSLTNVLFSNFGGTTAVAATGEKSQGSVREVTCSDAAVMMSYAKQVVIVPGYGLAVAQAQHACHQLEMELEAKGVTVKYAVHPVAGRMPGHMNVLLAEADVDYDKLVEMDEINPEFPQTDVALVVGANDVVNPAAKTDPSSPIYGMPILDVENARQVIVMKRSMRAGYAGIENELFFRPNTAMLFGDAKSSMTNLVTEVKAL
ncbi:MAG: NAD(P)(+) transhydrogenase (Re/Si-specific) subunit beta [Ignavibacteria bacterium]|nr:NAD(P)(+) transhydrogenase (Re/Si-specific) subunit beta [Ignavibacteria bacterium]